MLSRLYDGRYGSVLVTFDCNVAHISVRSGVIPAKVREMVRVEGDSRDPSNAIWIAERKREAHARIEEGRRALEHARTQRKRQKRIVDNARWTPGPENTPR